MRIERLRCDCCGREVERCEKLVLPIRYRTSITETVLSPQELDICAECANVISNAYYNEAEKHNHSGILAIDVGGSNE